MSYAYANIIIDQKLKFNRASYMKSDNLISLDKVIPSVPEDEGKQ